MKRCAGLVLLLGVAALASCRDGASSAPSPAKSSPSVSVSVGGEQPALPVGVASNEHGGTPRAGNAGRSLAMSERELGALISSLSEPTGDFPSDNFVSNETSYLHVAPSLLDPSLRGKAYVGVGPEQNLTYLGLMQASIAYVVDIRRQNMLEHLVLRACMEPASSRVEFLAQLTSRDAKTVALSDRQAATVDEIAAALGKLDPSREHSRALGKATTALMTRLGVKEAPKDRRAIQKIVDAFARKGLDLTYSMEGSARPYPPVRALLAMNDPDGRPQSFVGTERAYRRVRGLVLANRVVPVVGDFGAGSALRKVADDIRRRRLTLGVFYTSNVEQYLFEGGTYGHFVKTVEAYPSDDSTVFVRVWFDQGRAHPRQREGHRTTSLVMGVPRFLERWQRRPYTSYWQVVTDFEP